MGVSLLVLLALAVSSDAALVTVVIGSTPSPSLMRFNPAHVTVAPGDTLRFFAGSTVTVGQRVQRTLGATNESCTSAPSSLPTFFSSPSLTNGNFFDVLINSSYVLGTRYWFKGNDADCVPTPCLSWPPTNGQTQLYGSFLVANQLLNCSSATTLAECQRVGQNSNGAGGQINPASTASACIWCGRNAGAFDIGFCYAPSWYGTRACPSCPPSGCPAQMFPDFGCPVQATGVIAIGCGHVCTGCPSYRLPVGSCDRINSAVSLAAPAFLVAAALLAALL